MNYRYILLMTFLATCSLKADEELPADAAQAIEELKEPEENVLEPDSTDEILAAQATEELEPDPADEILELIKDQPLEMPIVETPSRFTVFIREWGLALAYRYYALKEWIFGGKNEVI
jgi:hypothetical protein